MPPTSMPAGTPDMHARALIGFAALMQQCNPSWVASPPVPIAGGKAVRMGNWAIGVDLCGHADRQFGRYANCNPVSRCLNCSPFCSAEVAAVDLSINAGGCAALWVEAENPFGCQPRITVRSFVPGLPVLSDVWTPTVSPVTGQLHLVATNGARIAVLEPNGMLTIDAVPPAMATMPMEYLTFYRRWKTLISMPTSDGTANLTPLAAMRWEV